MSLAETSHARAFDELDEQIRSGRTTATELIRARDGRGDHSEIVYLSSAYDFPWDFERSLELALLRTFCVPSISAILDRSGEFAERAEKRYDDTELILAEVVEHGYDSQRGREAIERLNAIHGRFRIGNDDYLYVLSTFIYEPIRWIARFGWRRLTDQERAATFWFWHAVGRRMNIRDVPDDCDEFERFNREYERVHFRACETNRRVGIATRRLFLGWFPPPVRSLAGRVIDALVDEPMRAALGYRKPLPGLATVVAASIHARSQFVARLPHRRAPRLLTKRKRRTYPSGYEIRDLGPHSHDVDGR